jgi:hypothetical protein
VTWLSSIGAGYAWYVPIPYPWPVAPFDEQHPVRAYFNDPRIAGASHAFHFGIDVSAPDGTPVYAVAPGTVYIEDKGNAVAVRHRDGRVFGYWHVKPSVGQHAVVGLHELIGHIEPSWGHVHLAESRGKRYVDPLRPGALTPFVDVGNPTVQRIMFRRGTGTKELPPAHLTGRVMICCVAFDTTPLPVPPPWAHMPVSPALVRYRVVRGGTSVVPWKVGVDLRTFRKADAFHVLFGKDTRQNHPGKPGLYVYNLAHDWNTAAHPNGTYRIDVEASDIHGNRARSNLAFTIENGLPPL